MAEPNSAQHAALEYRLSLLPGLSETIHTHGLRTKKSLGQHFLLDQNVTNKIVRYAGSLNGRTVIEVGPGPGGLTRSLLATGAHVIAIEKDERCLPILQQLKEAAPERLSIVNADALTLDYQELLNHHHPKQGKFSVVSNLPYNVGTELLICWLKQAHLFESMVLMFQKEVAQRITAFPGDHAYGRLSVLSNILCETSSCFDLPAAAFTPPPKVDSSVILLSPRKTPLNNVDLSSLERITQAAFSQRRKMLRQSLKQLFQSPENVLQQCNIAPTSRPEVLSLNDFCALANYLDSSL